MFEKKFRVICNDADKLSAEIIAQALLDYFSLTSERSDISFGVIEEKPEADTLQSTV